jgi:hypothetical protein
MATIIRCDRCGMEFRADNVTSFSKLTLDQRTKGSCLYDLCRPCTLAVEKLLAESPPRAAVKVVPVESLLPIIAKLHNGARRLETAPDAADEAAVALRELTTGPQVI